MRPTRPRRLAALVTSALLVLTGSVAATPALAAPECIAADNGSAINQALANGGAGATVTLCAGATIELTQTIRFTADGQTLTSEAGNRATIILSDPGVATAISTRARSNITVANLIVNGNRAERSADTSIAGALIEAGAITTADGKVSGFHLANVRAENSRRGALLHILRYMNCTGALIENSEFIDAGDDFTDEVGLKINDVKPGNSWADGIRLDCSDSIVRNNTIVDATDAGIVIFGSPGSIVENNHIIQRTKTLLGAINLVDNTTKGNYTGVIVRNNTITADGGLIRSAIGMGNPVWSCGNTSVQPYYGATVTGNVLEGSTMGWGYSAVRVRDWTATGNVDNSTHIGIATVQCDGYYSLPVGFAYTKDQASALDQVSGTFQSEFTESHINDLLFLTDPFSACKSVTISRDGKQNSFFALDDQRRLRGTSDSAQAARYTPVMEGLSTVRLRDTQTGEFLTVQADGTVVGGAGADDPDGVFMMIRMRNSENLFGLMSQSTGKWLDLNASGAVTATTILDPARQHLSTIPRLSLTISGTCAESLTWTKTDDQGTPLAGSQWSLTGPSGTVQIVDNGALDTDPAPGVITVANLTWGSYQLTETAAPDGYLVDPTVRPVTLDGTTVVTDLGELVNQPKPTPTPTPTPSETPTPTPSQTPTPTPSQTPTPSPTAPPSTTPTPSLSPSATPSPSTMPSSSTTPEPSSSASSTSSPSAPSPSVSSPAPSSTPVKPGLPNTGSLG